MSLNHTLNAGESLHETENQGPITITTKELMKIINLSAESSQKEIVSIEKEPLFLDDEEIEKLTGRKRKGSQIEALKQMAIAFRVNAIGRPVVTRADVTGQAQAKGNKVKNTWTPGLG